MDQATLNTPKQVTTIFNRKKIVYISCGTTFTMAVTENGEVYSWGENNVGQLGIGNYENQTMPMEISSLKGTVIGNFCLNKVIKGIEEDKAKRNHWIIGIISVKVACGYEHTLALTDEGELYAWGRNHYGQLGIGNLIDSFEPVLVNLCLLPL